MKSAFENGVELHCPLCSDPMFYNIRSCSFLTHDCHIDGHYRFSALSIEIQTLKFATSDPDSKVAKFRDNIRAIKRDDIPRGRSGFESYAPGSKLTFCPFCGEIANLGNRSNILDHTNSVDKQCPFSGITVLYKSADRNLSKRIKHSRELGKSPERKAEIAGPWTISGGIPGTNRRRF